MRPRNNSNSCVKSATLLQVALCVLQYLAWVVQANSRRKDGTVAGPAEAALARRLLEVVKAAGAAEATGEARF